MCKDYSMVPIEQIRSFISTLSEAEKTDLLRVVTQELVNGFPGVESTPGICGGDACIVRTRIPVWALEQWRRLGKEEAEILQMYPTLRPEDLLHAWAYADAYHDEIDGQIRRNEDA